MRVQAKVLQVVSQLMSLNMLMWLTMLILLAAILFMAAAVYMAIAAALPPAIAALLTGVALLAVFILLSIVIVYMMRAPSRGTAVAATGSDANRVIERDEPAFISKNTADWTRDNAGIVIVGALVSGVALAASPGLRRFVVRAAGPMVVRKLARGLQGSNSKN